MVGRNEAAEQSGGFVAKLFDHLGRGTDGSRHRDALSGVDRASW
jgi:hypothetical protein